jgi:hypothetical protein
MVLGLAIQHVSRAPSTGIDRFARGGVRARLLCRNDAVAGLTQRLGAQGMEPGAM